MKLAYHHLVLTGVVAVLAAPVIAADGDDPAEIDDDNEPNPNRFMVKGLKKNGKSIERGAKGLGGKVKGGLKRGDAVVVEFDRKDKGNAEKFKNKFLDAEIDAPVYSAGCGFRGTAAASAGGGSGGDVETPSPEMRRRLESTQEVPWGINNVFQDGTGTPFLPLPEYLPSVSVNPVCIIDSGYQMSNPDLPDDASAADPSQADELDNDNFALMDWCYISHGTHVAGTIAAKDNSEGVIGVFPGAPGLKIVKVFGVKGSYSCDWSYSSSLIDAANHCVDSGAKIISMSLGSSSSSSIVEDAFIAMRDDDDVLVIAAAGNGGNSAKLYPASYPSIMSVGATKQDDTIVNFSQYNDQVDISAPGFGILSTVNNGYGFMSGTSMATPHVSGVAALLRNSYPACDQASIRDSMELGALDAGDPGRDDYYGHGIVRYWAAEAYLLRGCGSPSPRPVIVCSNRKTSDREQEGGTSTSQPPPLTIVCTLSSGNDYTGTVDLSCPNSPAGVTCSSISPPTVNIDASGGSSFEATVTVSLSVEPSQEVGSYFLEVRAQDSTDSALVHDSPSVEIEVTNCPTGNAMFRLELTTDAYAYTTTWDVINLDTGDFEITTRTYLLSDGYQHFTEEHCLSPGVRYQFTIRDSWKQDGISLPGGYAVYLDDILQGSGSDFGSEESLGLVVLPGQQVGETGRVVLDNTIDIAPDFVKLISFRKYYANPVVVAFINTRNASQPVQVRVKSVTSTSCEIFMQEPSLGPDAGGLTHAAETASYIVLEAGRHVLDGGLVVEAGTVSTTMTHTGGESFEGEGISFSPGAFQSTPAILHTLNSYNNGAFLSSFVTLSSGDGTATFEAGLERAETNIAVSSDGEMIAWVAFSTGSGTTTNGASVQVGTDIDDETQNADGVDNFAHHIVLAGFDETPDVVVSQIGSTDLDGSWARGAGTWKYKKQTVYAEEDRVTDKEQKHGDGVFAWAAFAADTDLMPICFTGTASYVTQRCTEENANCCQGENACDNFGSSQDKSATICAGSCNGDSACRFIGADSVINTRSCVGDNACLELAMNNKATVASGSCKGGNNACYGLATYAIRSTIVGWNACLGTHACSMLGSRSWSGSKIGDGSCTGDSFCSQLCLDQNAAEIPTVKCSIESCQETEADFCTV